MPVTIFGALSIPRATSVASGPRTRAIPASMVRVIALGVWTALACGGASSGGTDLERARASRNDEVESQGLPPPGSDDDSSSAESTIIACTDESIDGLRVWVENPPVDCASLSVVATDEAYSEVLACAADDPPCFCRGAAERAGTYLVSVSAGDPPVEFDQAGPVTVSRDGCHVIPRTVSLRHAPLQDAGTQIPDAGGLSDI